MRNQNEEFKALGQLQSIVSILFGYLSAFGLIAWGLNVGLGWPRWTGVVIFITGFILAILKIYHQTRPEQ